MSFAEGGSFTERRVVAIDDCRRVIGAFTLWWEMPNITQGGEFNGVEV